MKKYLLPLLFVFFSFPVAAVELGVRTGQEFPSFSAKDQYGKTKSFDDVVGDKGVTFFFVRSADWCPYCQKQLGDLNAYYELYAKAGYPVVGVSYDSVETLKIFSDDKEIKYTLLSDKGSKLIKDLGIMNQKYSDKPDHFAYGVPYPAVIPVSKEGNVLAVYAEESYKDRPDMQAVLDYLKSREVSSGEAE